MMADFSFVWNGYMSVLGDPIIAGIMILLTLVGILVVNGATFEITVLVISIFLGFAVLSFALLTQPILLVVAIVGGAILGLVLLRSWGR